MLRIIIFSFISWHLSSTKINLKFVSLLSPDNKLKIYGKSIGREIYDLVPWTLWYNFNYRNRAAPYALLKAMPCF